ncbi:MAG: isoprenylcysteine carboxylmethyltransferase family protein [Pseudomonadota bacterium]
MLDDAITDRKYSPAEGRGRTKHDELAQAKRTLMLKLLDLPPIWLIVFLALARIQAQRLQIGPSGTPLTDFIGGMLAGGGVLVIIIAVRQMVQVRTTIIPHRDPEELVSGGIFRYSRNPIYLGDAMILTGLILYWGAWPSLVLVPLFVWLITDRFVVDEEARLQAAFSDRFDSYRRQVRRWI